MMCVNTCLTFNLIIQHFDCRHLVGIISRKPSQDIADVIISILIEFEPFETRSVGYTLWVISLAAHHTIIGHLVC